MKVLVTGVFLLFSFCSLASDIVCSYELEGQTWSAHPFFGYTEWGGERELASISMSNWDEENQGLCTRMVEDKAGTTFEQASFKMKPTDDEDAEGIDVDTCRVEPGEGIELTRATVVLNPGESAKIFARVSGLIHYLPTEAERTSWMAAESEEEMEKLISEKCLSLLPGSVPSEWKTQKSLSVKKFR